MRILALETSGTSGTVATLDGELLLIERSLDPALRSARSLAPTIQQLLREVDWKPRDVQAVAVAIGPGSFTGLRLGVMTAKAFAYAVGAQVQGIGTLAAIAARAPATAREISVAIDAQRGELYVARFGRAADGKIQPAGEPTIEPVDQWLAGLNQDTVATGPALAKLADRLPAHVRPAPRESWFPMASAVGELAAARLAAGSSDDLWTLAPLYLRRSAAEEKLDRGPH